jgi:hypothetical protein
MDTSPPIISHQYLELHRWTFENSLLLLHRHGAMQGQNPGTFTSLEMDTKVMSFYVIAGV